MNAHTPGPWIILPWFAKDGSEVMTVQAVNRTVADIPGEDALAKANAHLIAASPDLLVALEACIAAGSLIQQGKRGGESMGQLSAAIDRAREVVAKARGRT